MVLGCRQVLCASCCDLLFINLVELYKENILIRNLDFGTLFDYVCIIPFDVLLYSSHPWQSQLYIFGEPSSFT